MFDLSHLHTTTINNGGSLVPICLLETIPNDTFEISVNSLIRVLPQVVPLYSKQRLYIHGFYSSLSSLWDNAQTFMTKGYSGNVLKSIPQLSSATIDSNETSLFNYFGIPSAMVDAEKVAGSVNALPFMMYLRIYRDYYMNKNYYINNRCMLPDKDCDFRLNDDGLLISDPESTIKLNKLLYRDYPQDYFTFVLPFPQRGDTPLEVINE